MQDFNISVKSTTIMIGNQYKELFLVDRSEVKHSCSKGNSIHWSGKMKDSMCVNSLENLMELNIYYNFGYFSYLHTILTFLKTDNASVHQWGFAWCIIYSQVI